MKLQLATAAALLFTLGTASAAEGDRVQGEIAGDGISGTVTMEETASGVILIEITAEGVPEGEHGVHVHETGQCEGPTFESAGGHLARGLDHGVKAANGPHPGDLPNVHVASDGVLHVEYFTRGFTLGNEGDERLLDDDGSAFIIHSGADDYESQPSGDAGDRIACAVLEAAEAQ